MYCPAQPRIKEQRALKPTTRNTVSTLKIALCQANGTVSRIEPQKFDNLVTRARRLRSAAARNVPRAVDASRTTSIAFIACPGVLGAHDPEGQSRRRQPVRLRIKLHHHHPSSNCPQSHKRHCLHPAQHRKPTTTVGRASALRNTLPAHQPHKSTPTASATTNATISTTSSDQICNTKATWISSQALQSTLKAHHFPPYRFLTLARAPYNMSIKAQH